MAARLTFRYDQVGDIRYIDKGPPYPEQDSEELDDAIQNTRGRQHPKNTWRWAAPGPQ